MSRVRFAALFLALAAPLYAQERPSGKYDNRELGLAFSGVYGWESEFKQGSGAWNDLAIYREQALDALVVLQVRNNIYKTIDEMRAALKREFASQGEPAADKTVYKEIAYKDVRMKRGLKLNGIEAEGYTVRVTDEGKKREHFIMVRTYFGKNRLFRVHCSARRSRAKRVRDRFDIAIASLVAAGAAEQVIEGTLLYSERGRYSCVVPSGFRIVLPGRKSKSDMRFTNKRTGVTVTIYSYTFVGELIDHRDVMTDYYKDDLEMEDDDVKALGGIAFRGVLTRGEKRTLIVGTVKNGRAYRIHTSASKSNLEDAKRTHKAFLKALNIGR